jgi:hypothetical protein
VLLAGYATLMDFFFYRGRAMGKGAVSVQLAPARPRGTLVVPRPVAAVGVKAPRSMAGIGELMEEAKAAPKPWDSVFPAPLGALPCGRPIAVDG